MWILCGFQGLLIVTQKNKMAAGRERVKKNGNTSSGNNLCEDFIMMMVERRDVGRDLDDKVSAVGQLVYSNLDNKRRKHRYARSCVAVCFFNAHGGSPACAWTALWTSWPAAANHSPALWTRTGSCPRTFGSNYLIVRALVFFVWQGREAPKEWPWLMKNQRWVPAHWTSTSLHFSRAVAEGSWFKRLIFTCSPHLVKVDFNY